MSAYAFLPCRDRGGMFSNREPKLQPRQVNPARRGISRLHRSRIAFDVCVVAPSKEIVKCQAAVPFQSFAQGSHVMPGKRMIYAYAAGRISVDHPFARHDVAALGERLKWHGGLTLDYLFRGRDYAYIECNPRTVEPANAAASGVDLPGLQLRLSVGEHPAPVPAGKEGVRTHSSLAILLGTASYRRSSAAVLGEALRLALHRGPYKKSRECLTPVFFDVPSLIPLAMVAGRALLSPISVERFAASAVKVYSVTPGAIERVREAALAGK